MLSHLSYEGGARVVVTFLADLCGVSDSSHSSLSHVDVIFRTLTHLAKVEQQQILFSLLESWRLLYTQMTKLKAESRTMELAAYARLNV